MDEDPLSPSSYEQNHTSTMKDEQEMMESCAAVRWQAAIS